MDDGRLKTLMQLRGRLAHDRHQTAGEFGGSAHAIDQGIEGLPWHELHDDMHLVAHAANVHHARQEEKALARALGLKDRIVG